MFFRIKLRFSSASPPLCVFLSAGGASPKSGGSGAEERGVLRLRRWRKAHGQKGVELRGAQAEIGTRP